MGSGSTTMSDFRPSHEEASTREVRFELGPIELEFQVVAKKDGGVDAKVGFHIFVAEATVAGSGRGAGERMQPDFPQPTGSTIPTSRCRSSESVANLASSANASRCGTRMRLFSRMFGSRIWNGLLCIAFSAEKTGPKSQWPCSRLVNYEERLKKGEFMHVRYPFSYPRWNQSSRALRNDLSNSSAS
jgi:hypothetical protein